MSEQQTQDVVNVPQSTDQSAPVTAPRKRHHAVWSEYGIDPLDLIGKSVTVIVVRRKELGVQRGGVAGDGRRVRKLHETRVHGVVHNITEDRGTTWVLEDQKWDEAAEDAHLGGNFDDTWPRVVIDLGSSAVDFQPEHDWVRIEWYEA